LDREKSDKMSIENHLRDKIRELQDVQNRFDQDRQFANARVQELMLANERLKRELCEKERLLEQVSRSTVFKISFAVKFF
jgi:hypothetical protein